MTGNMNHRGHREVGNEGLGVPPAFLCVLRGRSSFLFLTALLLLTWAAAQSQPNTNENRLRYDIKLTINFDERTYAGTEVVHWVNKGDHATSTIFFHLY